MSSYEDGWIIADAKSMAADYDASVEPNRFVRRGEVILTRRSVLNYASRLV